MVVLTSAVYLNLFVCSLPKLVIYLQFLFFLFQVCQVKTLKKKHLSSSFLYLALTVCCLQYQDLAVTMAAQMKATADEVAEHRKRYQAKDDAVKQLRRRKMESHDSKLLVHDGADIKVLCCLKKTSSIVWPVVAQCFARHCLSLLIILPIIVQCLVHGCPLSCPWLTLMLLAQLCR